ncbi:hypothetical protein BHU72_00430 [Desulfuribacillus stibiiarsenatis]|uniref:Uncharacterized protein n=2 Tax=Desulfuribacillus stibiiarsenatis TaxID=1390249 RepID=A0A1E5L9S2_9FIRM|nr:hypothetical protein BHU72_00430 [Desulfuribacillus stibiiarsenatis]
MVNGQSSKKSPFKLYRTVPINYIQKPMQLKRVKKMLQKLFHSSFDLVFRPVGDQFLVAYLYPVIDMDRMERTVLTPLKEHMQEKESLIQSQNKNQKEQTSTALEAPHINNETQKNQLTNIGYFDQVFTSGVIVYQKKWKNICSEMIKGSVVVFQQQGAEAAVLRLPNFEHRAITEPDSEKQVRGPREGFIEDIGVNMSLLRKKMRSPSLVFEQQTIGNLTETRVVLAYAKGICDPEILQELRDRLSMINIQGVLESGYLEAFIVDHPWTPFPQTENTEKPDKAIAEIMEGRIAILVDGSPNVILVPVVYGQFMQASEDYYENFWYGSALRILRALTFFIALFLPGIYVAITSMHQEMLPTSFALKLAGAREGVPFPAIAEAFFMEIAFEFLREAGIRLPAQIGQAVSIVGALIIGQAAVEAGIVSPVLVVVVALSGIASFVIPSYRLAIAFRLIRFAILLSSGILGLIGITFVALLFLIHLSSMHSFGVPYFEPVAPFKKSHLQDWFYRANWQTKAKKPFNIAINKMRNKVTSETVPFSKKGNYPH